MTTKQKSALVAVVGVLAFVFNWHFLNWTSLPKVLEMNDVRSIISGYEQVPNLLLDSGHWWTGTWIQEGISAYRPLASYLYWVESWVGIHWGFFWVGWIGVLLLVANALLSGVLAWRLTRSRWCVWLAAVLAVALRYYNWSNSTPDYWLAWYPVHQELLMNCWLMAAIACFDSWNETSDRKLLACSWLIFLLGIFTKEHNFIFPAFALAIVQLRKHSRVSWRDGMIQAVLMLGVVVLLWMYRSSVLVDPRNPELKLVHLIRKPFLYLFYPYYKPVLSMEFWFPGLATLLLILGAGYLRWRSTVSSDLLQKPATKYCIAAIGLIVICLYCAITYSVTKAFWYLFDSSSGFARSCQLAAMMATLYSLYLLWKYRKTEPTALAFALLVLAYLPVITYLGWHYTVAAWFIRCAYWALVAKLVWLDVSPILLPLVTRFPLLRFRRFRLQPLLEKS